MIDNYRFGTSYVCERQSEYIFNGSSRVFLHLFRTSVNDLPLRHYTIYFYLPSHTITLCYVVLHSFLFADMMHDLTIQKELGQLVIRISLVQGRYARYTFRYCSGGRFMTIVLLNNNLE